MKQRLSRMITQVMPLVFALLVAALPPANAKQVLRQVDGENLTVTDTLHILFPVNIGYVDETFADNANSIRRIKDWIKVYNESDWILDEVLVVGSCSPDGSIAINRRVSSARTQAMLDYCHENIHEFDNVNVRTKSLGRDWEGLLRLVKDDPAVPFRNEVTALLRKFVDRGQDEESDLDEIKGLRDGVPYGYMHDRLFEQLRIGYIYVTVTIPIASLKDMTETQKELIGEEYEPEPEPESEPEPEPEPEPECETCKPFYMSVKTNLLYDLGMIPNIAVEFYLGSRWSIGGDWKYSWWKSDKKSWYWQTYGGEIYLRKWFGKKSKEKPLQGHHLGIYGQMTTYDYETGKRGYLSDKWSFGGGIEYGYALPITGRLNLDFGLGVGYLGGQYKEYLPIDDHYVWQSTKKRHYIGPTKAEITLVWLIGCDNYNRGKSKKGGAK